MVNNGYNKQDDVTTTDFPKATAGVPLNSMTVYINFVAYGVNSTLGPCSNGQGLAPHEGALPLH